MEITNSTERPGYVLIVAADMSARRFLEDILTREGYEVKSTGDGDMVSDICLEHPPDVILLDYRLPGLDTCELSRILKSTEKLRYITVIFMIGGGDLEERIQIFEGGGDDYLVKPLQAGEVLTKVKVHSDFSVQLSQSPQRVMTEGIEDAQGSLKLKEILDFEILLTRLSGHFVNIPSDKIDSEIEFALRNICEFLGIESAAIWQRMEDESGVFKNTHFYASVERETPPERLMENSFPWVRQQMLLGRIVLLHSLEDLPEEADIDRESGRLFGIKSNLTIPLSVGGGHTIGIMGLNTLVVERDWPDTYVKRLQLVAQIFAVALARKNADEALYKSEELASLAAEAGEIGIWSWNVDSDQVSGSGHWLKVLGRPSGVNISFDDILQRVHEDDRDMVRRKLQQAASEQSSCMAEFRLTMPGGIERWITLRGRMQSGRNGKLSGMLGTTIDLTERKRLEMQLRERLAEIEELKSMAENENAYLHKEIEILSETTEIVGKSIEIKNVLLRAGQVAETDSSVLLVGETGTGKELIARAIHRMSSRKNGTLVTVNCASLPTTLIESELFGREKGAYTDALTKMAGRFELADKSTLFLDEIGELPLDVQSKFLRVLEDGTFQRLGSTKTIEVNVRIIAATNRNLKQAVKEGLFREDLFYRLNVFPLAIPPLRERPEDIPQLVWTFVKQFEITMGKRIDRINKTSMISMQRYSWPGNIRELKNVIEYGMILSKGGTLSVRLPEAESSNGVDSPDLDCIVRDHLLSVLTKTGWRVGGRSGAAEILGVKRTTLQSMMKRLGINRPTAERPI